MLPIDCNIHIYNSIAFVFKHTLNRLQGMETIKQFAICLAAIIAWPRSGVRTFRKPCTVSFYFYFHFIFFSLFFFGSFLPNPFGKSVNPVAGKNNKQRKCFNQFAECFCSGIRQQDESRALRFEDERRLCNRNGRDQGLELFSTDRLVSNTQVTATTATPHVQRLCLAWRAQQRQHLDR